ncbi:MAG TPA: alpha-L-rhamnosidase C-terminal domain-containing protein, partial [Bacilli bacterium]
RKLYNEIVRSFRKEFVTPNGRLAGHTQTAHVLALMFDLVEGEDKKRTVQTLADYIEENKFHLTTGFVGTPYLCLVLSENGYHDIAAKLIHQQEYPSWLYSVAKGATTIWEHWDGIKEDGSFWSDDMNSFNHYAYGAVGDWLYRVVAGIDTDEKQPGYKHILFKPRLTERLTYAKAALQSIFGEVSCGWEIAEDGQSVGQTVRVKLAIPANTTATAELPLANIQTLYEQGEIINTVTGVLELKQSDSSVVLKLASGSYDFSYKLLLS